MDILRHILDAGLPVLAIVAVFAAWIYVNALGRARKG